MREELQRKTALQHTTVVWYSGSCTSKHHISVIEQVVTKLLAKKYFCILKFLFKGVSWSHTLHYKLI